MNYEDQVAALFANANPVPSLDLLDPVEALDMEHLAYLSERSSVMTDVETEEMKPEGPGRRARIAFGVAMAVIAVVALGSWSTTTARLPHLPRPNPRQPPRSFRRWL